MAKRTAKKNPAAKAKPKSKAKAAAAMSRLTVNPTLNGPVVKLKKGNGNQRLWIYGSNIDAPNAKVDLKENGVVIWTSSSFKAHDNGNNYGFVALGKYTTEFFNRRNVAGGARRRSRGDGELIEVDITVTNTGSGGGPSNDIRGYVIDEM
jgi:hypothetical protein